MAFSGKLSDFGMTEIFQLIQNQSKTGVLQLRSYMEHSYVCFLSGNVVFADINQRCVEEKLKRSLIYLEHLSSQAYKEIVASIEKTKKSFLQVFMAGAYLPAAKTNDLLTEIVLDITNELLTWDEGGYFFDPEKDIQPLRFGNVLLSTDTILLEGMRRIDEWKNIRLNVPTMNLVYQKNIRAFSAIKTDQQDKSLGELEQKIFQLIDGKRSVMEMVPLMPYTEYRIFETIASLKKKNYIHELGLKKKKPVSKIENQDPQVEKKSTASGILAIIAIALFMLAGFVGRGFIKQIQYPLSESKEVENVFEMLEIRQDIRKISNQLQMYALDHGRYPEQIQELRTPSYLADSKEITDPRRQRYLYYRKEDGSFRLYSGVKE